MHWLWSYHSSCTVNVAVTLRRSPGWSPGAPKEFPPEDPGSSGECFGHHFGSKNDFINSFMKVFAAGLILLPFVIVGHSTINGFLTQILIYIHLIGISYWIGSFLPLLNMGNKIELYDVAIKFGNLAVAYILFLLVSGLMSFYLLLGDLNLLFISNYGNILLMKMVFVILLLGLGALNKYRLVPSIKDNFGNSKKKLTRSINIEIVFALSILFLTSILTTSVTLP